MLKKVLLGATFWVSIQFKHYQDMFGCSSVFTSIKEDL